MTVLAAFKPTTTWQEIPGVSGIPGIFLLRNSGYYSIYLYIGNSEPFLSDIRNSFILNQDKERILDNTEIEKVWALTPNDDYDNIICINKG